MTGCGQVMIMGTPGFEFLWACGKDGWLCPSCAAKLQARLEELEKQLTMSETLSQSREENRVRALKAWQDAERRVEELEARQDEWCKAATEQLATTHECFDLAKEYRERVEAAERRAEALARYARHREECGFAFKYGPCDCGLAEVLK